MVVAYGDDNSKISGHGSLRFAPQSAVVDERVGWGTDDGQRYHRRSIVVAVAVADEQILVWYY